MSVMMHRPSLDTPQVAATANQFAQLCEAYYGPGDNESKRQIDTLIQEITNNVIFPDCFLYGWIVRYDIGTF